MVSSYSINGSCNFECQLECSTFIKLSLGKHLDLLFYNCFHLLAFFFHSVQVIHVNWFKSKQLIKLTFKKSRNLPNSSVSSVFISVLNSSKQHLETTFLNISKQHAHSDFFSTFLNNMLTLTFFPHFGYYNIY